MARRWSNRVRLPSLRWVTGDLRRIALTSLDESRICLECGDLSPLCAGDLSPSSCRKVSLWRTFRALDAPWLGDKSPSRKTPTSRRTPHQRGEGRVRGHAP